MKRKRRSPITVICILALLLTSAGPSQAQIGIIGGLAKRIIMAIDLRIQRLQTRTIYLQDAEREAENNMQTGELSDIAGWLQQLRDLYAEYYQELWTVKSVFMYMDKTNYTIKKQAALLRLWKKACAAVRQDPHFSGSEVEQMISIYTGLLNSSLRTFKQLSIIIQSFFTQMDDWERLQNIDDLADRTDANYEELAAFIQENFILSLQRAKDMEDIATIRSLYGIP